MSDADRNGAALMEGLRAEAKRLGLSSMGIAAPDASEHIGRYRAWLADNMHGKMGYLEGEGAIARRADLCGTLEGVRSVLVVTHEYSQPDPEGVPGDASRGVIARYARGRDYHDVLKAKLEALGRWLVDQVGEVESRAYTDTGPILERDLARRAGLGWFGKNTMLIDPRRGSYFFLGMLLVDVELPADTPFAFDRCGSCTECLDACPTGALLGCDDDGAPLLDARGCISYLTIELRGPIPRELRPLMGNRIFGCDICQEVCPYPRKFSVPSVEPAYSPNPELDGPLLVELAERLLSLSGKAFLREFAGSPVTRARRNGLLRNVCVALGNWGAEEAVSTLVSALSDPTPLVRGHAAWALGRVESPSALDALSSRLSEESDPFVLDEIALVLRE